MNRVFQQDGGELPDGILTPVIERLIPNFSPAPKADLKDKDFGIPLGSLYVDRVCCPLYDYRIGFIRLPVAQSRPEKRKPRSSAGSPRSTAPASPWRSANGRHRMRRSLRKSRTVTRPRTRRMAQHPHHRRTLQTAEQLLPHRETVPVTRPHRIAAAMMWPHPTARATLSLRRTAAAARTPRTPSSQSRKDAHGK